MKRPRPGPAPEPEIEPLRADVRLLGALLGDVLREQGGAPLFERVEAARLAARARRRGEAGADASLDELLRGLEPDHAGEVARAFSAYFALVNMAERVHRIRRRREYLASESPQPGSLRAVAARLQAAGISLDRVREQLGRLRVEPVLTAHPTEAIRRTILAKEQRVARLLVDRIERSLTAPEEKVLVSRLREEVTLMWQTAEHPGRRRTVADEVEHILFYLADVVYRVAPALDEAMASALDEAYGPGAGEDLPCPLLTFGSWVGGDMDGNPNVGPETILDTLERHRGLVLERLTQEVRDLFRTLSQSLFRVGVDPAVKERCREYRRRMPEVARTIPVRYHDMPYRVLLWFVWARLEAARTGDPHAYAAAGELVHDLGLVAASLRHNRGAHAGLFKVRRLMRRVATFGFHLATLDVRQDASVHRRAVGRLLGDPGFAARPPEERSGLLHAALVGERPPAGPVPDGETAGTIQVFEAIARARRRHGPDAVGIFVISMAQGPDDALAVLLLARRAGLVDAGGRVPLDIAPLFETVSDLDRAGATLEAMLAEPAYRAHVAGRGGRQVVMLGYSDSSKESGIAASRWALYRAESALAEAARRAGVELTLFHGRGGTIGRGGSKPRAGILAEPPGAVQGRLRVTEQGEIIHAKYGLRGIALRTLELMTGAVLEASILPPAPEVVPPAWASAMDTVAAAGRSAYRDLVYADPDFEAYFRQATPIDVIERLEIGSRPASRDPAARIAGLRAIPWVFAWTQSRHLLPGWMGVGGGLEAALAIHGEDTLREMAAAWPFFANLLADVEMVLAKSDLGIAARYAALAGDVGRRIFPLIEAEHRRTRAGICTLLGTCEPLEREPILRRSIRLRNPYVDPISLLQVDLLARWRRGGRSDAALEKALRSTVRGIARGLQNTG